MNVKTGLTPDSIKNMVFGAGVIYKNFSYGEHYKKTFDKTPQTNKTYYTVTGGPSGGTGYTEFEGDTFTASTDYYEKYTGWGGDKIGATKEGTTVKISPEYVDIEVDGVLVKMKGLTRKTGETATIEANILEFTKEHITTAINGEWTTGTQSGSSSSDYIITTKADLNEGDYISNLAIVAPKLDTGKHMAVIFETALCTSGFEVSTKNKDVSQNKYTFEAYTETNDENVETLGVKVVLL